MEPNDIKLRILVVDDQPIVLRSTARLLEGRGHEVVQVSDADEAGQVAETFDVAVVDVELEDGSGVEVARALLARGVAPRIVFFTAVVGAATLKDAADMGWVVPKGGRQSVLQLVTAVEAGTAPSPSSTKPGS